MKATEDPIVWPKTQPVYDAIFLIDTWWEIFLCKYKILEDSEALQIFMDLWHSGILKGEIKLLSAPHWRETILIFKISKYFFILSLRYSHSYQSFVRVCWEYPEEIYNLGSSDSNLNKVCVHRLGSAWLMGIEMSCLTWPGLVS